MIKTKTYETVTWTLGEDTDKLICKPDAVHKLFTEYADVDWDTEQYWVIGMNVKNFVHLIHLVAKGSYNSVICTPADIFIPLLRCNLRHFICVHNHPSGDTSPSEDDLVQCKKVKKASETLGLSLLDNLIISEDKWYSFKKGGLL